MAWHTWNRDESWISGPEGTEKWGPREGRAWTWKSGPQGSQIPQKRPRAFQGCTLASGDVAQAPGALLSSSVGFLGSVLGMTLVEGSEIHGP